MFINFFSNIDTKPQKTRCLSSTAVRNSSYVEIGISEN